MAGRWGGDIKGRRRGSSGKRRRDWQAPRAQPAEPRLEPRLRAGTMLAGVGVYLLVSGGALLTLLG